MRPEFFFVEDDSGFVTCTVTLPNCVKPSLRSVRGGRAWHTERAAMKDAAFQSCVNLFRAGLLNDHFLPLSRDWREADVQSQQTCTRTGKDTQLRPFARMARAWATPVLHQATVLVRCSRTNEQLSMSLTTPEQLSNIPGTLLYWDANTTFEVGLVDSVQMRSISANTVEHLRAITKLLDRSTHSDQSFNHKSDFVFLFGPGIDDDQIPGWLKANEGRIDMMNVVRDKGRRIDGLVRCARFNGTPLVFSGLASGTEDQDDPGITCTRLFKRRNFETPNTLTDRSRATPIPGLKQTSATVQLSASECTVDLLDYTYARFNLFIPSLLRHIEAFTVARHLRETILQDVPFRNTAHIVTAITAPSAGRATDYQRFEFFGDAILKFQTSVQLFADHSNWPEGYLSQRRDSLVSNARLARAAVDKDLGCFILTYPLQRKWSPPYISDADQEQEERVLGTKVLADVVESLVGAAYIDSGFETARSCINVFIPEICALAPQISSLQFEHERTTEDAAAGALIGYQFRNWTLLLEALTHPSCGIDANTESYQRLEFLGDAILDVLISTYLSRCQPELSQGQMTRIKAALANSNLLGYVCLRFSMDRNKVGIKETSRHRFTEERGSERVPLWKFMRHHSPDVVRAHRHTGEVYDQYGAEIDGCLCEGAVYPWRLLSRLDLPKFYSDIVESIFGAIFVDSRGDLSNCERLFERIGLATYASRMIEGVLNVVHPRDELQRLAGSSRLEIDVAAEHSDGVNHRSFRCTVKVDGNLVSEVQDCISKEQAYVAGAETAVSFLSLQKKLELVHL